MEININIEKRHLVFLVLVIGMGGVGYVVAISGSSGVIPNPGHSLEELETCNGDGKIIKMSGGVWTCGDDASGSGTGGGTVTSVDTGTGLKGGPITTSGTISLVDSTKGCGAGSAIQSFDLANTNNPVCVDVGGGSIDWADVTGKPGFLVDLNSKGKLKSYYLGCGLGWEDDCANPSTGYIRVIRSVPSYSDPDGVGYVDCPTDYVLTGGGAVCPGSSDNHLVASYPLQDEQRWWAVCSSGQATIYAICVKSQ